MDDARRRIPGRPPLDRDDPSVHVHVSMPSKQYDQLYRQARRERTTIPDMIRRALKAQLDDDDLE